MRRASTWLVAALAGFLPVQVSIAQRTNAPSTSAAEVFTGRFITLDTLRPRAEAMAVRDGRIVAIGTRAEVDAAAGPGARHTALDGVALPGFVDAHVHAASLGESLVQLDLRGLSKAAIVERVRAAAARAARGAWIQGSGWDQSFWPGAGFPTASDLDRASHGHPVLLERIDGHAVWANGRAMRLAGVTHATADVAGGRIVRDSSGTPTGVFVDDAIPLVRRAVPPLAMDARVRRLRAALARYAQWGLTGIHDAGIDRDEISAYHALAREGALPVHVYAMASASSETLAEVLPRGPEIGTAGGTFTLRTVKIVDDGALGSRGARLTAPYSDDASQRGFDLTPGATLDSLIERSLTRGFQVAVHAIGDASTRDVLDAFARVGARGRASRFRLEHASLIDDADLPRLAALGVIASMQPVFVGEYSRFAEARVGAARLPWVYRTRDVVASGAIVAAGTDFPASDTGDPIATLSSMVTRRGDDGTPADGWLPSQGVSVDATLRAMTIGAAYAAFDEREAGILSVGRRADLTVLSDDPYAVAPGDLRRLTVRQTIVGGRTTYRAPARRR